MNKITIIEKNSGLILNSYTLDEEHIAFQKAMEYEAMNLDIEIKRPNSIEQLGTALGASKLEFQNLKCELNQELESH